MKAYYILIISIYACCSATFAQTKGDTIPVPLSDTCFAIPVVDQFPLSEEWLLNFTKTVADSCLYSQSIFNGNDRIIVIVELSLDRNGYLGNFRIIRSVSNDLDNEVLSVMKRLCLNQKHSPALKKGENVCVEFMLPIKFYKKP